MLSFNGNSPILGGTVPNLPSSISAAPGTTVTIPNVIMQLNCSPYIYEFVAWNTHSNGMGTTYRPGQSITLNSNVTLYAKWRLVYAPPGGGGIMGEAPDKPNEPERAVAPYPVKAYIYNYADSNWKDKLTSIETYNVNASGHMAQETVMNLTYDAMGNPTSYIGATLTWNGKQLSSYTRAVGSQTLTYAYRYNEDGLRTQKIASMNGVTAETTNYYYNGSVLIALQAGNTVQRFSYDAQGKVVSVNYNGTEYYYLRNAQGDIVKLIDNNKNTVVEYTYDSWGKLISTTGSLATSLGANQPFRYRGYVYDTETGWYYLQSRYYNPGVGRFISSDVYLSTGQGVLGHNSYAYCLNNPVNMFDGEGTIPQWVITGVIHLAITASPGGWIAYCAAKGIISVAGNAYLAYKGYDLARAMFNHGMWGHGKNPSASLKSLMISRLKASKIFKTKIAQLMKCTNDPRARSYYSGVQSIEFKNGKSKEDRDLYFSLQHIKFTLSAYITRDGKWRLSIHAWDIYNFDDLRFFKDPSFGSAANDLGWAMQRIGMMVEYDISVWFDMEWS